MTGLALGASALLSPLFVLAHEDGEHGSNSLSFAAAGGSGSSFLRVDPSLNLRLTHGTDAIGDGLEVGGHDPNDEGFNFQGLELGANIYAGDHIRGFINTNIFKPDGEEFEGEFEEGFIKFIDLPGNLEVRAGRLLGRFGDQNAKHQHAFDFVNSNIGNIRFLGEEGLAIEGGEVSWLLPTGIDDILSVGFGTTVEEAEEEEEGGGEEGEGELAIPLDNVVIVRYQARFGANDFHRFQAGASFVTGDNGFDRRSNIYGADVTYSWRENGLEPGGKQFRWRTEWIARDVETNVGSFDENTVNTALLWEFAESWEAGLRYDWVEGANELDLDQRYRISTSLVKRFDFGDDFIGLIRVQYDHDDTSGRGTDDTVWLQFGFDWGRAEIR